MSMKVKRLPGIVSRKIDKQVKISTVLIESPKFLKRPEGWDKIFCAPIMKPI